MCWETSYPTHPFKNPAYTRSVAGRSVDWSFGSVRVCGEWPFGWKKMAGFNHHFFRQNLPALGLGSAKGQAGRFGSLLRPTFQLNLSWAPKTHENDENSMETIRKIQWNQRETTEKSPEQHPKNPLQICVIFWKFGAVQIWQPSYDLRHSWILWQLKIVLLLGCQKNAEGTGDTSQEKASVNSWPSTTWDYRWLITTNKLIPTIWQIQKQHHCKLCEFLIIPELRG